MTRAPAPKGRRAFYKRYPGDFMMGTRDLSLEERGAYNDLLDMMYDRGRPIPDEPRWIAGLLGISVKKWNTIRASLLDAGKLVERGEYLSNPRFERDSELEAAEKDAQVTWGRMGGKARAARERELKGRQAEMPLSTAKEEENGGNPPAPVKAPLDGEILPPEPPKRDESDATGNLRGVLGEFSGDFQRPRFSLEEDEAPENNGLGQGSLKPARASQSPDTRDRDKSLSSGASGKAPAKPRKAPAPRKKTKAVQMPKRWVMPEHTDEIRRIVAAWPPGMLERELARFKDHAAQNGRTCKDWDAAWRNWIRKADDDWKRAGSRPLGKPSGWAFAGGR